MKKKQQVPGAGRGAGSRSPSHLPGRNPLSPAVPGRAVGADATPLTPLSGPRDIGRPSAPTVRQLHGAGAAQGPGEAVELLHGSLHPRGSPPDSRWQPSHRTPQPMAVAPAPKLPRPPPVPGAVRMLGGGLAVRMRGATAGSEVGVERDWGCCGVMLLRVISVLPNSSPAGA